MKKVEDDDSGEASEPENPMMLSRDPKDWKVCLACASVFEFLLGIVG